MPEDRNHSEPKPHQINASSYGVGWSNCHAIVHEPLEPCDEIMIKQNGPVATKFYKFMDEQYARSLCESGVLRIRDLGRYHDSSLADRQDRREGRLVSNLLGINNTSTWITTKCFVLCMTRVPFKNLSYKFRSDDGRPATCVEINNISNFLQEVDIAIRQECETRNNPITSSLSNHVAYCDFPHLNFGQYGCSIPAALIKPHVHNGNQYWLESEYRAVWDTGKPLSSLSSGLPKNNTGLMRDITISSKNIASYCRIIDTSSLYDDMLSHHLKVRCYTKALHEKWKNHCRNNGPSAPLPIFGTADS